MKRRAPFRSVLVLVTPLAVVLAAGSARAQDPELGSSQDRRDQETRVKLREQYRDAFQEGVQAADKATGEQNFALAIRAYLDTAAKLPANDPLTADYRKTIGIRLGRTYEVMGQLPEAIGIYDSIPGLKKFSAEAMLRAGMPDAALARFAELGGLEGATAAEAEDSPDRLTRGEALIGRGRAFEAKMPEAVPGGGAGVPGGIGGGIPPEAIEAAKAYAEAAGEPDPPSIRPMAIVRLGDLYMRIGQYAKAAEEYAKYGPDLDRDGNPDGYLDGMLAAAKALGDDAATVAYANAIIPRAERRVGAYVAMLRQAETDMPPAPGVEDFEKKLLEWRERMKRRLTTLNGMSMELERLARALQDSEDLPRAAKAMLRAEQVLVSFRDALQKYDQFTLMNFMNRRPIGLQERLNGLAALRAAFLTEAGNPEIPETGDPEAADVLDQLRFTIPDLPAGGR